MTGRSGQHPAPTVDRAVVRRVRSTYSDAPLAARAFVAARFAIAPLQPLLEEGIGLSGRMLSLGCGYAALERYLAEINPRLDIDGIDLDPRKVEIVNTSAAKSPRVHLHRGDATQIDFGPVYDAVLICDALHHFPFEAHLPLAKSVAGCLRPGGVCIVKDLDVTPRWKHAWNRMHDRLVAGSEPIMCRPISEMAAVFTDAGLIVERAERTDGRLVPYAHYVIRLRKPSEGMAPGQP